MASANFTALPLHLATAAINFSTATFKCMLVTAVPSEANLDAWVNRADVVGEATGTGYTAGGVVVAVSVGAVDTANNRVAINFADLAPGWTSATISAAAALVYVSTGNAATDKLVSMVDFGQTVSSTAGSYSVDFTTPLYING